MRRWDKTVSGALTTGFVLVVALAACSHAQLPTTADEAVQASPAAPAAAPEYLADPKFQKALEEARQKGLQFDEHLARWKRANKLAKGQCAQCLREMVRLQERLQEWKDAMTSAQELQTVATDPEDKFYATSQYGQLSLLTNDGHPKPDQLKLADASLQTALQMHPNNRPALYAEGRVLAMMGREDDAKAEFQHYVDRAPAADHLRLRAEHFVENPHLATMPMAPPFTVVTSEGEEFNLDDMNGKVVLLDFWATWCGPCKETLPELQHMAKEFAGEPFVIISISSDQNPADWRGFIQKNNMTWPQYRDANGQLSRAYGVTAIPHYFTIDADGVLTTEMVGSDSDVHGKIKKLIARAKQGQDKKAAAGGQ